MYRYTYISKGVCLTTVRRRSGSEDVLLKGVCTFMFFPLIDVSSLVSAHFVQVEAFFVHCPLFATAQMTRHMFIFHFFPRSWRTWSSG